MTEPSASELKERAIRDGITHLLSLCTEEQQQGLHTIHDHAPWKGLAHCPVDKLDDTHELLRRTVSLNHNAVEVKR